MQHLRYALRTLGRNPLFAAAAVLTIAIAIGANTAIFSVVDVTLLRGTPGVRDEGRLATVSVDGQLDGGITISFGVPGSAYMKYNSGATRVSGVAGFQQDEVNLGTAGEGGAQRAHAEIVSDNYFAVLGTRASVGRLLDGSIGKTDPASVTISHRLWQRAFAGDPAIAGKTVMLNGRRFTITGVAEQNFVGIDAYHESDVWVLATAGPLLNALHSPATNQDSFTFGRIVARLRPNVALADAQREAERFLDSVKPSITGMKVNLVVRMRPGIGLREEARRQAVQTAWILVIGVGFVLLIACANVANLFLARGATRLREVALRRSLGASNWALVRQVVIESLVVSTAAAAIGIVLALWGTALLEGFKLDQNLPSIPAVSVDARMLAFAVLLSLVTAALFALPPVLGTLRSDAGTMLRSGDRAVTGRSRAQGMLVIAQVAVSFALMVGATLFVRTVHNLRSIDLGFRPDIIGVSLDLGTQGYAPAAAGAFVHQLQERLRARPQIQSVAATQLAPFDGITMGHPRPETGKPTVERQFIGENAITVGYFKTLGIPLVEGRDFTEAEVSSGAKVAVVSAGMAKEFWPGRDPIGQRLLAFRDEPITVIGVAGDTRTLSPQAEPDPYYYTPFSGGAVATMLIRSTADRASIVQEVRKEVAALDRNLPIYDVLTIAERVDRSFAEQIATARLTSIFGIVGLVLALIGLYAVISFTVAQRTRELAIRVALGARDGQIRSHVMGDALRLVIFGLVIGGVAAFGLAKLVSNRLYGISGTHFPTYALTALIMTMVAGAASYLPARRATRVDPMTALRAD